MGSVSPQVGCGLNWGMQSWFHHTVRSGQSESGVCSSVKVVINSAQIAITTPGIAVTGWVGPPCGSGNCSPTNCSTTFVRDRCSAPTGGGGGQLFKVVALGPGPGSPRKEYRYPKGWAEGGEVPCNQ